MISKTGFIYILTSQSFPDYVKMGYTTDIEHLLDQLNGSGCLPYPFKVHAVYVTDVEISNKKLQNLLISLNPALQSCIGTGDNRLTKDFYAISAENAYALFEAIAEISGTKDRLIRADSYNYKEDKELRSDVLSNIHKNPKSPISFIKCGIPLGSKIHFVKDPSKTATVVSDREVEYLGRIGSLTRFTMEILHDNTPVQGPRFWTYMGKRLTDIRYEREEKGIYK